MTADGAEVELSKMAKAWWHEVSSMPHCVLWTATDWRFAVETALLADMFFQGDRVAASELRIREKVLGTTVDARRDLRIRYVSADEPKAEEVPRQPATVTVLGDRRERLLTGDAD